MPLLVLLLRVITISALGLVTVALIAVVAVLPAFLLLVTILLLLLLLLCCLLLLLLLCGLARAAALGLKRRLLLQVPATRGTSGSESALPCVAPKGDR